MLHGFVLVIHVLLALMIIGLVLLQRGKGAEAGAGFGAGASGTVFGARGTSTLFSKLTAIFAALFFTTSLTLAYMGTRQTVAPTSVLERAALQSTPAAPAAAPSSVPAPASSSAPASAPSTTPATPVTSPAQTAPDPKK
jgi:preprotein translocase subunit SecG